MDLPLDPDEWPGTPEYEELCERRNLRRKQLLTLLQEQHDADQLQFPFRFGH